MMSKAVWSDGSIFAINEKELPDNLRVSAEGDLFCADGQDPLAYIKKCFGKGDSEVSVVILCRKPLLTLNRYAICGQGMSA